MPSDRPRYITEHLVELRKGPDPFACRDGDRRGTGFLAFGLAFRHPSQALQGRAVEIPRCQPSCPDPPNPGAHRSFYDQHETCHDGRGGPGLAFYSPGKFGGFAAPALKPNERVGILMVFCLGPVFLFRWAGFWLLPCGPARSSIFNSLQSGFQFSSAVDPPRLFQFRDEFFADFWVGF